MWIRSAALLAATLLLGGLSVSYAEDMFSNLLRIEQYQADQGDAEAQFSLAVRYETGRGVDQDMESAVDWYTKAANGGHAQAQYRLGQLYEAGQEVSKNAVEANAWYAAAASNGHQLAQDKVRIMNEQAAVKPQRKEPTRVERREPAPSKAKLKKTAASTKPPAKRPVAKVEPKRSASKPAPTAKSEKSVAAKAPPRPRPVAATAPPQPAPEETVVATAPPPKPVAPPPPAVTNPAEVVMASRWSGVDGPAPFLPSEITSCLSSGADQVLCFSREMKRTLRDSELTFMAKATLGDFKEDGSFRISYLYNVTDIDSAPASGTTAAVMGLRAEKGWQPELVLECLAEDEARVRCVRDGHALDFRAN